MQGLQADGYLASRPAPHISLALHVRTVSANVCMLCLHPENTEGAGLRCDRPQQEKWSGVDDGIGR